MKYCQGVAECHEDGEFQWDGYISDADFVAGEIKTLKKRLQTVKKSDGKYVVVPCPYCHRPIEKKITDL